MDIRLFNHLRNVFSHVFLQKQPQHLIVALPVQSKVILLLWSPWLGCLFVEVQARKSKLTAIGNVNKSS